MTRRQVFVQQMPGPAQNMPCSVCRMVRTRSEAIR
jgi:hypothetical protein